MPSLLFALYVVSTLIVFLAAFVADLTEPRSVIHERICSMANHRVNYFTTITVTAILAATWPLVLLSFVAKDLLLIIKKRGSKNG